MTFTYVILTACLLDYLFGEVPFLPHPVVLMGNCVSRAESFLRSRFSGDPEGERAAGSVLAVVLPLAVFALTFGILRLCRLIHPALFVLLETFWCYQALAARGLAVEAEGVRKVLAQSSTQDSHDFRHRRNVQTEPALQRETQPNSSQEADRADREGVSNQILGRARMQVARIVGRDTDQLDEAGIIRACVETVAENSSDGVIAPLIYMLVGGAPLALAYKAVNTMDSMIGYKNERYLHFGRTAARLDDFANFIPSRIAALCWVGAAYLDPHADGRNAWRVFRRDRMKHASPNSAQTEAACAGALHVRLAGPASYFGKRVEKPYLGDDDRPVETEDIRRSVRLMWICSALALAAGVCVRSWICL